MLTSVALSARAYLDPVTAIPSAVDRRAWVVPLLWLMLTAAASGAAFAERLDASSEVLPKMAESGELAKASEREVNEEIEQSQRITLVGGVAKGLVGMPFAVLLIAVALKFVSWLMGKKALFGACFTTAALAMLPVALYYLLSAVIALTVSTVLIEHQQTLTENALRREANAHGETEEALRKVSEREGQVGKANTQLEVTLEKERKALDKLKLKEVRLGMVTRRA